MLIHSSEELYAVFHPGESEFLLITFGFNGMEADNDNFWGKAFCVTAKLNAVGFMSRRSDWFPASAMEPAISDVLHAVSHFKRRITYGSSMGGYGAIRYAKELGAEATLAYAPQYSIDPSKVGHFDPNFSELFNAKKNSNMEADGIQHVANHPYILYDPSHHKDNSHVLLIKEAAPQSFLIPVHHMGHAAGSIFAGSEKIVKAITSAINFDAKSLWQQTFSERRNSPVRLANLALTATRKHPVWASKITLQHGPIFPTYLLKEVQKRLSDCLRTQHHTMNENSSSLIKEAATKIFGNAAEVTRQARVTAKDGKIIEAISMLQKLLSTVPRHTDALSFLVALLMQEKRYNEAAVVARRWAEVEMDNSTAHQYHAVAEDRSGNILEAIEAARRAVSYSPNNAKLRDLLAAFYQKSGSYDLAFENARRATELDKTMLPAQVRLSLLAAAIGKAEIATEAARSVIEIGGKTVSALRMLAIRLKEGGEIEASLEAISEALALDPKNSDLLRQSYVIRNSMK